MANWLTSMEQSFEYYIVDPGTWKDIKTLNTVTSCSINRDLESETLGSATINVTESLAECYVRVYLVVNQNGVKEKYPLGTFLAQSPSTRFNGKIRSISVDAYTPLIELKETQPPIGYSSFKDENIMDEVYRLSNEHARAPVVKADNSAALQYDFVADTNDTWLSYIYDLMANAKYEFALDELGRILFSPKQDTASLQPVWTYNDDNSSILLPDVSLDHDLYGVPNVVEVVYARDGNYFYSKVVNDDPNSPISTVNRGREILYRETNPDILGYPDQGHVDEYANQLLRTLSSFEHTVSYSHGYCPVRVGDCVRLNYTRAGLNNVKAKVISQTIDCSTGCKVSETAIFTTKLWG